MSVCQGTLSYTFADSIRPADMVPFFLLPNGAGRFVVTAFMRFVGRSSRSHDESARGDHLPDRCPAGENVTCELVPDATKWAPRVRNSPRENSTARGWLRRVWRAVKQGGGRMPLHEINIPQVCDWAHPDAGWHAESLLHRSTGGGLLSKCRTEFNSVALTAEGRRCGQSTFGPTIAYY